MSIQLINNFQTGATGYGLMGFTYSPDHKFSKEHVFECFKEAIDNGATVWNSADNYGNPNPTENLELLEQFFETYPEYVDKVYLTVKGGGKPNVWGPDGSEANVRRSIDTCLKHLGKFNKPDVYITARVDPENPIEIAATVAKEYIDAGKLKGYGLSESSSETIKKVNKIVPVSMIEIEYSVWAQEAVSNGVFETCTELGIPVIAYSPIGRGYLTGEYKSTADLDVPLKQMLDRFNDESLSKNYAIVEKLKEIADAKGVSNSQVALEFVRYHSNKPGYPTIIPIPGTTNLKRIAENCAKVDLTAEDVKGIEDFMSGFSITGSRYNEQLNRFSYR